MISKDKITEIFCSIYGFCKVFELAFQMKLISDGKKQRNRAFRMSQSEILTITVLFHKSGYRTFKHFYLYYVQEHLRYEFPVTVSYNRFTELMQSNMLPLVIYMKTCCLGKCWDILCRLHPRQGVQEQEHQCRQGVQGYRQCGQIRQWDGSTALSCTS